MIDTNNFLEIMHHAKGDDEIIESSAVQAIKLDNPDGLGCFLGFNNSTLSKVDYYLQDDHVIIFLELSDLEEQIKECNIQFNVLKSEKIHLTTKELRNIRKKAWRPLTDEFKKKWCGSIAVIERLYRHNNHIQDNPNYKLYIVCRNHTSSRMLDTLVQQLTGMMGNVKVTNTDNIPDLLPNPI